MSQTVGMIGAGFIGGTLARLAVAAGVDVVLSNSRGPDTLADLVAELGPRARAGTTRDAAQADLVVATVPLSALTSLPAEALSGRTVIDTINYYPERDGRVAELDSGALTSSELLQRHLPGAAVVKAVNNISFFDLARAARPTGAADRSALPVAGDDVAAVAAVTALLDVLGYDVVHTGDLSQSWRSEPGTPVYADPYYPPKPWPTDLPQDQLMEWLASTPGPVVPTETVRDLVEAAVRGPAGGVMPS